MTSTPQRVRTVTELDYWQMCKLPIDIHSATQSKKFIKKIVGIAFSNICFLRTNFPDDTFHNLDFGKRIQIRMLKESENQASNTMITNLRGAFDAYNKGYLKQLEIVIRAGDKEEDRVLETYTFHLGASDDKQFFTTLLKNSKSGDKNISLTKAGMMDPAARTRGMELLRKATRYFMRELSVAVEGLDMLPERAVMEMHVLYTPETPEDYNAPGFETTNEAVRIAGGRHQVFKKTFNELPTPYHKVQLKLKSVLAETVMSSNSALPEAVMDSQEMEDESVDTTKNRVESEPQADVTEQVGNQTANQSTMEAGSPDLDLALAQSSQQGRGRGDAASFLLDRSNKVLSPTSTVPATKKMSGDTTRSPGKENVDLGQSSTQPDEKKSRKAKIKRKRPVRMAESSSDDEIPVRPAKRQKTKRSEFI